MSRWRKRLFVATARLTADAAEYFRLPRDRTVIMGSRIELCPGAAAGPAGARKAMKFYEVTPVRGPAATRSDRGRNAHTDRRRRPASVSR